MSMKFRTAPLDVSEVAERPALDALCPPSPSATGDEMDLFTKSGYLSLRGKVEKLQKPRMARLEVPILDLQLRCGETLFEISLWRDQALCELHEGDVVVLSHLSRLLVA